MDEEAVREFVDDAQSILKASPQMDEANTKAAVLRNFLDLLGWTIPDNTQLEYSVKAFGRTFKVDYALVLESTPVAFLEAKGVDTTLTQDHKEQIQEYMKSEDVNLGILTNGAEYVFFRRQVIDTKVNVVPLVEISIEELPKRITILRAFTTNAIQNDEWQKILNRISELKEARTTLENDKDDLADEIAELLTGTVSPAISAPAESQAKEMIDRLIRDIDDEINPESTSSSLGEEQSTEEPGEDDTKSAGRKGGAPFDTAGRYVIKISDSDNIVAAVSGKTQTEAMVDATDYLIEYHNLTSKISIPWVPAQDKAIINDESEWEDADPLYQPLSDGYYLDTKMNKNGKKREIRRMAGVCGVGATFDGDW